MCGIFAYFGDKDDETLIEYYQEIQHRGPDDSKFVKITPKLKFGFHRLAINGLDSSSDQPLRLGKCLLICNGEIYNYAELRDKYEFDYQSHSDCEIILHLYKKFGLEESLKMLDGVFSLVLYDGDLDEFFVARDRYSVRQLFYSFDLENSEEIAFCSEAKGLRFHGFITQFPGGKWWRSSESEFHSFFNFTYPRINYSEDKILPMIREKFILAVKKRTMSDKKIGSLLSGGLDSSLIAGVLAKFYPNRKNLETFSIGLPGSPDLEYAQVVATFLGTTHHSVEVTEVEFLGAIEEVIYVLGSFDVTTIRASVGHWLICQYIKNNSEVKVLYSGEYADEQNLSYLYGMMAPSPEEFQKESIRLLKDIGYFDNLRGDHCVSNAGLEARIPFADKDFMDFMMSINPKEKMFDNQGKMEKYLLRKAFEDQNLIPASVLWRRKNGFSDSVSDKNRSWSTIIQEYVNTQVSDTEFKKSKGKYILCPPQTKESYFYRKIFEKYYPSPHYYLTPYQWLPKWCGDVKDPSARVLNIYKAD